MGSGLAVDELVGLVMQLVAKEPHKTKANKQLLWLLLNYMFLNVFSFLPKTVAHLKQRKHTFTRVNTTFKETTNVTSTCIN